MSIVTDFKDGKEGFGHNSQNYNSHVEVSPFSGLNTGKEVQNRARKDRGLDRRQVENSP